ncbi:MAG: HAMP domain-containing sensor histidine kinase [Planctomycetota bacterium]|nr:HAMP domain-containing sensor histidine kinase [Planctomycetota bacterium]
MRICVHLPDPMLARALIDLLRAKGHEATQLAHGGDCDLLIQTDTAPAEETEGATLILRRTAGRLSDQQPADALRRALAENGTAVWRAPLDVGLLLQVLERGDAVESRASASEDAPPDLSRAPHAWLLLDIGKNRVDAANPEARAVLDLPSDVRELALGDLPIAGALREAIREDSEGIRPGEVAGSPSTTAWWTDRRGRRIVCFLQAPTLQSPAARNRQSLAELGQMAATLTHEIRNPVASLAGALDLLETEEDPIDRAEILEMARDRLKQLSRLLEKTLNLARPITAPTEDVELEPVIASAVSTLTLDPRFQHIDMDIAVPPGPVVALALEGPLLQSLTNLLLNAAQAQGGRGRIRIELTADSRRAFLRVSDEGPGIPPEKRQEIFKPFYTTKPAGTGLGLAEVRRAMEAMDGAVIVEEAEGGASFRLELPLAKSV